MVLGAKRLVSKIFSDKFPKTIMKFVEIAGANHETAFPTTVIQGLYWLLKK